MTEEAGALPEVVTRLAVARGKETPFLAPHHVEAARRLTHMFARARLNQRVTMSYDPARVGGRGSGNPVQGEISAGTADMRRRLTELAERLPPDCWNVVFDICCFDLGLQDIEARRDWPRRGGKLVLRIGLSQIATLWGLEEEAIGRTAGQKRFWRPERPPMFSQ